MKLRSVVVVATVVGTVVGTAVSAVAVAAPAVAVPQSPPTTTGLVVGLRPGADADLPADRVSATGVDVVDSERIGGLAAVTLDVPADGAAEAVAALRADPAVRYVEPAHRRSALAVTADDPLREQQWGLDRAAVPGAWQHTQGSAGLVVAVLDTGVNGVPDLAGALLPGRDYINGVSGSATDDHGHGTSVAAIIAGRGDDGNGVAGACWSCKILPVKVLDGLGFGDDGTIAAGIYYAANAGADIINLSLGGQEDSLVLRDAVAYAVAAGALVVAAAGNDGGDTPNYPAAVPGVLAVGASGSADTRYSWSSYGASWVDIAAPGCGPAPDGTGAMRSFCGTSGAAPLIAGIAALVMAQDVGATAADVATALTSTADPIAGGWVESGRVNAARAVESRIPAGDGIPTVSFAGPAADTGVRGTVGVTVTAADDGDVDRVELLANGQALDTDSTAPYEFDVDTAALRRYSHLTAVAYDDGGRLATADLPLVVDNAGPALAVVAPAYRHRVRGPVAIRTTATDASGVDKVELVVAGQVVGTDSVAPYAPVWSPAGYGPVTLTVRAYDSLGNVSSAIRTIVVDRVAPSVSVSAPRSGARVSGPVKVRVDASDRYGVARVELIVNGTVARRDGSPAYAFTVNPRNWSRTMKVQVRAYDRAGNARTTAVRTWRR